MAKRTSSNPNNAPSFSPPRYRPRWALALTCMLLGIWMLVALIDFDPNQKGYFTAANQEPATQVNNMGPLGADLARVGYAWLGVMAWSVPLFLFWSAWLSLRNARKLVGTRIAAMAITTISGCSLAAMLKLEAFTTSQFFPGGRLGGIVGRGIYDDFLANGIGPFGSGSLMLVVYLTGLLFVFTKDIAAEFEKAIHWLQTYRERSRQRRAEAAELRQKQKAETERKRTEAAKAVIAPAPSLKKLTIAKGDRDPLERSHHPFPSTASAPSTSSLPPFSPKIVRGGPPAETTIPPAPPSGGDAVAHRTPAGALHPPGGPSEQRYRVKPPVRIAEHRVEKQRKRNHDKKLRHLAILSAKASAAAGFELKCRWM